MGVYYNFIQIFGRSKLFWLLPFDSKQGQPVGDGVVWPQKPSLGYIRKSQHLLTFLKDKHMKLI